MSEHAMQLSDLPSAAGLVAVTRLSETQTLDDGNQIDVWINDEAARSLDGKSTRCFNYRVHRQSH